MNRFDIIRILALATAVFAGGCYADATQTDSTGAASLDEGQVVVHDGKAGKAQPGSGLVDPHPTETNFMPAGGPSPDPWRDNENASPDGPSPDPWHPKARLMNPPGAEAPPSSSK